ncbi:MAG: alpha/beta hydrolase [Pedosphaera sp.]|nr:alpha/beta hydrolase [Pedosphaera sp.]
MTTRRRLVTAVAELTSEVIRHEAYLKLLLFGILFGLPSALLVVEAIGPRQVDALPASDPTSVQKYGSDPLQFGELRLPKGDGPFPVVVVIHGGCWTKGFATLRNTAAIASELTKSNLATWNIEYRQVGDAGGGWPGTFRDWGAATDYLRVLSKSYPLDLSRIMVVGHSAGAHAALWVAARNHLPFDSEIRGADPLKVQAAVAVDGPGDLTGFVGFDAQICGKSVIVPLMEGAPAEQPERYRQASPKSLLPLGVPQFLVTATVLTPTTAKEYQKLAESKGDRVEILSLDTGHFEVIAPGHKAWSAVEQVLLKQAFKQKPQDK